MIGRHTGLVVLLWAIPWTAGAQTRADAPRAGSWEIGGGVRWGASTDFGERAAELTRNPPTGTQPLQLFDTETTLEAAPGVDVHLAFHVTPAIALEGGVRYARPRLHAALSGDFEEAEPTTAEETISQYQFDGSLVWHLTDMTFAGGRAMPFVLGGAGHIRDVHQGNDLVETGMEFHGGGGLKWWFGSGRRGFGVRVEARLTSRDGGFSFGDERRTVPSGGVSLTYLF